MPQGDSNKGRVAKFLGHAWEVVYQALFFTRNTKLPRIQFPATAEAIGPFLKNAEKLVSELRNTRTEHRLRNAEGFLLSFKRLREAIKSENDNSRDCFVNEKKAINDLKKRLGLKRGNDSERWNKVSLKSGKNFHFHNGDMSTICNRTRGQPSTTSKIFKKQLRYLRTKAFWNKYLGRKGRILVLVDPKIKWRHFLMSDVVKALAENTKWSRSPDGRLKGKLPILQDKIVQKYFKLTKCPLKARKHQKYFLQARRAFKYMSVITLERKGKTLLLAANGNRAKEFRKFLSQQIPHVDIERSAVKDL